MASEQAALRFGFQYEATFLFHMGTKGQSRDTTVLAMLDHEWPFIKKSFEAWLDPLNFDENGLQKRKLSDFRVQHCQKSGFI